MPDASDQLFAGESPAVARALTAAEQRLFAYGYQALTMDELAHELGISKKTLYALVGSKDAMIERIIDAIGQALRTRLDAVVANESLSFPEKLAGLVAAAGSVLTRINPATLRDLQRFAPGLYQKIEDLRQNIVPLVFGRLIRDGLAAGAVRPDVDPAFATEFWLQAIRGLVQPATLERTQLSLPQTFDRALHLFFAGLLSPAARKTYEKKS